VFHALFTVHHHRRLLSFIFSFRTLREKRHKLRSHRLPTLPDEVPTQSVFQIRRGHVLSSSVLAFLSRRRRSVFLVETPGRFASLENFRKHLDGFAQTRVVVVVVVVVVIITALRALLPREREQSLGRFRFHRFSFFFFFSDEIP
jgi:hypothetical protein